MWASRAAHVRRLRLPTRSQIHSLLNGGNQPSYSVLVAIRSKCLQDRRMPSNVVCSSYLCLRLIHSEHLPGHYNASVAVKKLSDINQDVSTGAPEVCDLHPGLVVDSSRKTGAGVFQSDDGQLSIEAPQPPSVHPPSGPSQSGEDSMPGEWRQSGRLPVKCHGLAPYVAASMDLRRLVALGVDVSSWDRRAGIPQMVLKLDWKRDIAPRIQFLHDAGVPADRLAHFITRNPLIFKEHLDDLQVRLNYLEAKRFSREQVASVISRGPFWLMFSTSRIDRRLGLFVGLFDLKPQELRQLAAKCPSLITSNIQHIKDSVFTIREEFGFQREELKRILLGKPKVLMLSRWALQDRLQYLHNEMGLSHQLIADAPNVLLFRSWRVRQRHLMLNMLNRDQYDRSRPGYVSLDRLVGTTDQEFCRDVAQVPVLSYNEFLKTL